MKIKYTFLKTQLALGLLAVLILSTCKKDKTPDPGPAPVVNASPTTMGLYQYASGVNKRIFIVTTQIGSVSQINNKPMAYGSIFDTGSPGMTMDATNIIPADMITANGITVTGDSVVVNGITITSKTAVFKYGDATGITSEYGNLAYANVTVGDGSVSAVLKRVPFFLYYKIIDSDGKKLSAHAADVFGVGPGNGVSPVTEIRSPLKYFTYGTGLTNGFKLATLNTANFTSTATYEAGLLTLGLTAADLSASSGFIMHPLTDNGNGYSPNIPGTITYNDKTIDASFLFDTGSPSVSTIEDKLATMAVGQLPPNTPVTLKTNKGFTYSYTTSNTANLTEIQNPNNTKDIRTVLSIDFFIKNESLTDYTNHQIGLKNN